LAQYRNAAEILPASVLALVQRYAAGEQLYIPRPGERAGWGVRSGARRALFERNERIRQRRREGATLDELSREFHLSQGALRKILRSKNELTDSGP
jgi:Mor family transcriptional regulator